MTKGKRFMNFKMFPMALMACVFLSGMSGLNAAPDTAYLVKDGKAHAEIVISDNPERSVKLAAKELQVYLSKISGAQLQIVTAPNTDMPLQIYVGQSFWTDKLGLDVKHLKRDMYKVVS
jgi:hypothetical protein